MAVAAPGEGAFATQHQEAKAVVLHGRCQRRPEARAGIGNGHVFEDHAPQAGQTVGLGVQPPGGDHFQRPAALLQAARQGTGRTLRIQDGRARFDVDDGSLRQCVERAPGDSVLQRHIHREGPAAAGIELDHRPAGDQGLAAGGLGLAAGAARAGPDAQRPLQLPGQLHADRDALADPGAAWRQDFGDVNRGRWAADGQPVHGQARLMQGTQAARGIAGTLVTVGDDDDAGQAGLGVDCQGRFQGRFDIGS